MHAVLEAGAVYVPIDLQSPAARTAMVLEASEPTAVIAAIPARVLLSELNLEGAPVVMIEREEWRKANGGWHRIYSRRGRRALGDVSSQCEGKSCQRQYHRPADGIAPPTAGGSRWAVLRPISALAVSVGMKRPTDGTSPNSRPDHKVPSEYPLTRRLPSFCSSTIRRTSSARESGRPTARPRVLRWSRPRASGMEIGGLEYRADGQGRTVELGVRPAEHQRSSGGRCRQPKKHPQGGRLARTVRARKPVIVPAASVNDGSSTAKTDPNRLVSDSATIAVMLSQRQSDIGPQ